MRIDLGNSATSTSLITFALYGLQKKKREKGAENEEIIAEYFLDLGEKKKKNESSKRKEDSYIQRKAH